MSKGNGHARRTKEVLEALGFVKDAEASERGKDVYRHPNGAERAVKVWAGMSELAARKVRIFAEEIAGLSTHGEAMPTNVGEVARVKREKRKREEAIEAGRAARERAPFEQAAAARTARHEAERAVSDRERELGDIRRLMGGPGWA